MGDRLKGKVAVVTGAGGLGIGQGCALVMAREGADVVVCDCDESALRETVDKIETEGLSCAGYRADLTYPGANEALMAFAVEQFGGLDILVNAAAFVEFAPVDQMDYERQWRRTLQGDDEFPASLDILFDRVLGAVYRIDEAAALAQRLCMALVRRKPAPQP